MTYPLPRDTRQGVSTSGARWGYAGSVWVVTFPAVNIPREMTRLVIVPPAVSIATQLALWDDSERLTNAPNGLCTNYVAIHTIPIPAGMETFLVWGSGIGSVTPLASMYTIGRYFV